MSDPDATLPPARRYADIRIDALEERQVRIEERLGVVDQKMDQQTVILKDIGDFFATLRFVKSAAKWIGAVGLAISGVAGAIAAFFHGNGPR